MTTDEKKKSGVLYIVATPIGHRDDISLRAIHTLQSVDLILAEDTRHSFPLLMALGIKKPLISMHAFNEEKQSEQVILMLLQGQSCALISDAGTPLISDPGYSLVRLARQNQIRVTPIPGACAFITALSAAGIACDAFGFYGFLPAKGAARRQKLTSLLPIEHTLIFYESTHRILECLDDVAFVFGETCKLVIAKELTKTFECFFSGNPTELKSWLLEEHHIKGEFVLMIPPRIIEKKIHQDERLLSLLMKEIPLKQAVKLACLLSDASKNELYPLALKLRDKVE